MSLSSPKTYITRILPFIEYGGAKVGLWLFNNVKQVILEILFINLLDYLIMNNYKPTFAPPCISQKPWL